MRWVLCAFIVAGCAKAGPLALSDQVDAPHGDDDDQPIDAPVHVPIDAPVMATLSNTVNSTMTYGNSIGCVNQSNGRMADTNWYRTFQLSDFGIAGVFHVQSISLSVQQADGMPAVTTTLASYAGNVDTLDTSMMTTLGTPQTIQPPVSTDHLGENVTVPYAADIPAGGKFVVQVSIAQQTSDNHYMFIGASTGGEHHPGWYSSVACSHSTPVTTAAAGGTGQIIIDVVGTH